LEANGQFSLAATECQAAITCLDQKINACEVSSARAGMHLNRAVICAKLASLLQQLDGTKVSLKMFRQALTDVDVCQGSEKVLLMASQIPVAPEYLFVEKLRLDLHLSIAKNLHYFGDLEEAATAFRATTLVAQEYPGDHADVAVVHAEALNTLGGIRANKGDYEGSASYRDESRRILPNQEIHLAAEAMFAGLPQDAQRRIPNGVRNTSLHTALLAEIGI
jgi:hypothetical protein